MAAAQIAGALRQIGPRGRRLLGCAGLCVAVAGCAATTARQQVITVAPEPGRAVIIGWGASVKEHLQAALTPVNGTRVSLLVITGANNQKLSFDEKNVARLPPGEYNLDISCGIYVNYRYFSDGQIRHVKLEAGRVYRLLASPDGRRCEPSLEDVTGRNQP